MTRDSVRVLLIEQSNEVLLVRFRDVDRSWWCTPGGGVEAGESDEDAARREIREETDLAAFQLGPLIWSRRHAGVFRGEAFDQQERIYLGRVERFVPRPSGGRDQEHALADIRWWSIEDLEKSPETFAPQKLPQLVAELLRHGPPAAVRDVGV